MENSRVEDLLDEMQTLFDEQPESVETGLDVDGVEMLQLRKACRLLEAADHLVEENGYYTVVIEASFAAIEHTLQFYLLNNDFLEPDEYVDHQAVYEYSQNAGLYNEKFKLACHTMDLMVDARKRHCRLKAVYHVQILIHPIDTAI